MSDFLLELRSEEIPARMQAGARADLEKLFRKEMDAAGVALREITVWSTPRRLTLVARGLPQATAAVSEEVKGPRVGAPPQALEGFLRKTGLSEDQLVERDGVLFAVTEKPGRATAEVLAEAIPAIVRAFPWPKSQRWGAASLSSESLRWVRPLSGIVALLGGAVVECEVGGIKAGRMTCGHRFHSSGEISIDGVDDYAAKLRAAHVIVDQAERQDLIRAGAARVASEAGLVLVEDEGLVIENAGLTEWPVPLLGRFDEAYLDVPPEVIQLTARTNQKYFVCEDKAGKLANAFVCTANIAASDGGAAIVAGNRKVLAARLSDARHFWLADQFERDARGQVDDSKRKGLVQHSKGLARITFHEKLGTVADKVERVAKLAEWLVLEGVVPPIEGTTKEHTAYLTSKAATLCKADLVTEMVGEFPELQGLMGGYYARAEGLPDAVADAIRDHYKPVGQGDEVPNAPVTVAVSLADKLDTLVGFFAVNEKPTGSKDPFALRRAALGLISLLLDNGIRLNLSTAILTAVWEMGLRPYRDLIRDNRLFADLMGRVWPEFPEHPGDGAIAERGQTLLAEQPDLQPYIKQAFGEFVRGAGMIMRNASSANDALLAFVADRLKVQQREAGVRHDLIDAVFALGGGVDLVRLLARVHALQAFVGTEDGANLLAGYKRAANILKKEDFAGGEEISLSYTPEPAEKALVEALDAAGPKAADAVAAELFADAMAALASLRAPIDRFFDEVTVNDADPAKRQFRLALLARFRDAVHGVADFSKIEG